MSDFSIRPLQASETQTALAIINAAAERYRGAIPASCWHEPYMDAAGIEDAISSGVVFQAVEVGGRIVGVMGSQPVNGVLLIRHAYVSPGAQGLGLGSAMLDFLCADRSRPILVGTWKAATWAIAFYGRRGFVLQSPERTRQLLGTYWSVPEKQVEASVVLQYSAAPPAP